MLADYLDPRAPAAPALPREGLAGRWKTFLANPDTRAAMLQFGVQMLQPIGVGQTLLGQFGQAIGGAGETVAKRTEQRNQQQQDAVQRALAIAELGQRGRQIQNQESQFATSHALDVRQADQQDRSLDITQQNADTAAVRATRAAGNVLTTGEIARFRQSALKAYDDYLLDVEMGTAETKDDGTPFTAEEFVTNYLNQIGLTPDVISGSAASGTTVAPKGDLIAGSASNVDVGGPQVVTPGERVSRGVEVAGGADPAPQTTPDERITTSEYLAAFPQQWAKIQQMIQSADVAVKGKGLVLLDRIKRNLVDPENLR